MAPCRFTKVILLKAIIFFLFINEFASEGVDKESKPGEINFLILLPFEIEESSKQPWLKEGPMLLPAAEQAVEDINLREDLLAGYSVNMTVANSACDVKVYTIVNFVTTFFYSNVMFAGIVGPVCSDAVKLISPITRQEGISILNFHGGSSEQFTDRERFRYAFSTVVSTQPFVGLFLNLMKENKWESIAVLYEQEATVYLNGYDLLVEKLPQVYPEGKISFSAPVSNTSLPLSPIVDQHIRVVILMTTSHIAHKIMCLIHKRYRELTYPTNQFILIGGYFFFHNPVTLTLDHHHHECSVKDITQVMEGFLLTGLQLSVPNSTILESGATYAEYFQAYKERVNGSVNLRGNAIYDGVWSLALALNNSIPRLNEIGLDLVDYTYGHREATDIIREEVLKLRFQGASGHISYSKDTGFTSSLVPLLQVVNNSTVEAGYYDEFEDDLVTFKAADFVEGSFASKELVVHPALASLSLLIFVGVVALIISTHILTLVFYKFPDIRASSYRLGQLAFIGCYLIALCFLCFTVEKVAPTTSVNTTSLCVIQAWSLPLGLTLILGTVAAKTWRLYFIFIHPRNPGKFLHDKVLMTVVLILASFDVVLCSIWTAEYKFTTSRQEKVTDCNTIDVKITCDSESFFAWFGALSLYQGLIMASAFVLALLTKNIHHKSFKTKSVVFLVYFLTMTLTIGFPLYLILTATDVSGVNVEYTILSFTYLAVIFLCFVFLFFPPVLSLLRVKVFHKIKGLRRYSTNVNSKSLPPSSFRFQKKKKNVLTNT